MKVSSLSPTLLVAAVALSQFCSAEGNSQPLRRTQEADDITHYGFQSRIVGGSNANSANYPFHVSRRVVCGVGLLCFCVLTIASCSQNTQVNLGGCGGSLIHEDIVLTAAHCQPLYPTSVRIGGSKRNNGVSSRIADSTGKRHPNYSGRSQDYDVMLYKLSNPVRNRDAVPLNSDKNNPDPEGGDPLTVIGFGSTFEGGSGSNRLQEVNVKHVEHTTCNVNYRGQVEEDIMFCAGVDGGGKDTCQGDSGGPIVDANGVQVGVTSWGNGCARDGFPGVYARVSAVYDWIQEEICNMSDNPPASCNDDQGESTDPPTLDNTDAPTDEDEGDNPDSDLVQPKGISIRVDITYDEYPQENAWVLYNDVTKEELYFSEYGDHTSAGLQSKVFTDLNPGRYVFLMMDEYWDGVCCR